MNSISKAAEERRKFIAELPERAKAVLKAGDGAGALSMVLDELRLQQLTN